MLPTHRSAGYTLIDLLVALAVAAIALILSVPPLMRASGGGRVRLAAGEIRAAFGLARARAVALSTRVGVKFSTNGSGPATFTLYRDGDGDGVLSADIANGTDPALEQPRELAHLGRGAGFGFPPGVRPRDPADPSRRLDRLDDPIRFNRSDIASFGPLGESTPGSVYLTDGTAHLAVVRVFGRTARVRTLIYDVVRERWE